MSFYPTKIKIMKIVVNTSTFKQDGVDTSPNFINNLVTNMNTDSIFYILYPRKKEKVKSRKMEKNIYLYPYSYLIPRKFCNLSKYGLYPSIQKNKLNILSIFLMIFFQLISLIKICLQKKPDFIYSHWVFPQAFISALVGKVMGIKVVFTSHGSDVKILKKMGSVGNFIINFTVKNSHRFTSVSKNNLELLKSSIPKNYIPENKIIPMGVDNIFFQKKLTEKKLSENINILYFGRIVEYKGIDLLINAVSRIISLEHKKIKLLIIGSGIELNNIKNQSYLLGLNNHIEFIDFVNQNDLIQYIDQSDFVVVPSKITKTEFEAGPLTLIESMARQKICIVSDSVGFIEYLNEENSLVFRSNDVDHLCEVILKAIEIPDEDKNNICLNAKNLSLQFKYSSISKNTEDFIFN